MMRATLAVGEFADCSCHVLDLRQGTLFSYISNDAAKLLAIEFEIAEGWFDGTMRHSLTIASRSL